MGNWSKQQKEEEEKKEREKIRKEKLAGFFFNMALAAFSVWVLGITISLHQNAEVTAFSVYFIVLGIVVVYWLARLGNNKLK